MSKFIRRCNWPSALILLLSATALVIPVTVRAHSLSAVERQLQERESFLQIVNREVPAFQLQDINGKQVTLDEFRDKVVILSFIYATCTDVCPVQTQKLIDIQKMINTTPMGESVQFISITTDPVQDTPEVLAKYVRDQGVDPSNWTFLTSGVQNPTTTRELALRLDLKFTPTSDGQQAHGAVTHVIDKEGRLRARYHGLRFQNVYFIQYINALTNDFGTHQRGADPSVKVTGLNSTERISVFGGQGPMGTFTLGAAFFLVFAAVIGLSVRFIARRNQRLG